MQLTRELAALIQPPSYGLPQQIAVDCRLPPCTNLVYADWAWLVLAASLRAQTATFDRNIQSLLVA